MNNPFFENALRAYQIKSAKEKQNAIYEITQQVVLAGLHRGGFFDRAAFYGGTCLTKIAFFGFLSRFCAFSLGNLRSSVMMIPCKSEKELLPISPY